MAVAALVLCNPLCFLLNKYDKLPSKVLKSALNDFYDPVAISNAKKQLLEDMKTANFMEKLPNVPERRGGEMRTVNEIDDIFVLITFMDERKLFDSLPVYVADNPDNMPSMRLFEGDLKILMSLLEKMNDKLSAHGSAIAAIVSDLHSLQSKHVSSVNTANVHRPSTYQGVNNDTGGSTLVAHAVNDVRTGNSEQGNPHLISIQNMSTGVNKSSTSWADKVAVASTPFHSRSQVDVALSTATATDDDQSDNPFTEQHSRKYRRSIKRKMGSSLSPPKTDQLKTGKQQQQSTSAVSVQHRKRQAVYGRSSDGAGIAAANKLVQKAVFCVDNIDVSFDVEDIVRHVSRQGITVVSCFEAKPRNRRSVSYTNDRKAFRLCINNEHRDKLLNSSSWPDSVVVSEWFFKSQQSTKLSRDTPVEKRQRADHTPQRHQHHSEMGSESSRGINNGLIDDGLPNDPAQLEVVHADIHAEDDMDLTIITQDPSNSAGLPVVTPVITLT